MYKHRKKYERSSSQNPYEHPSNYNRAQRNNPMNNMINEFMNRPFFGIDDFSDPFDDMFSGFGFGRHNLGNLLGDMNNEFNNMQVNLVNGNNHNIRGANKGTVISQSYISKIDYSSGQPIQESYQSRAIRQIGEDGHKISEKQEAYKNSNGIQKAAHQRLLDNRGAKLIKQRNKNTGEQEEHNIFRGMNEEDLDNFNKEYNDYRQKVGFEKNYQLMNNMRGNNYRIGNGYNNGNRGQPLALPSGYNFDYEDMNVGQRRRSNKNQNIINNRRRSDGHKKRK